MRSCWALRVNSYSPVDTISIAVAPFSRLEFRSDVNIRAVSLSQMAWGIDVPRDHSGRLAWGFAPPARFPSFVNILGRQRPLGRPSRRRRGDRGGGRRFLPSVSFYSLPYLIVRSWLAVANNLLSAENAITRTPAPWAGMVPSSVQAPMSHRASRHRVGGVIAPRQQDSLISRRVDGIVMFGMADNRRLHRRTGEVPDIHIRRRPDPPIAAPLALKEIDRAFGGRLAFQGVAYRGADNSIVCGYSFISTDGMRCYGLEEAGSITLLGIIQDAPESTPMRSADRLIELARDSELIW